MIEHWNIQSRIKGKSSRRWESASHTSNQDVRYILNDRDIELLWRKFQTTAPAKL